jgi:hypothetical protein
MADDKPDTSQPQLVADVPAWFDSLPEGPFKQVALSGVFGCQNLRVLEVRRGRKVIGYASFAFEPTGAYWHHVLVAETDRRERIAESLFRALLLDMDRNHTRGEPAIVSARAVRDDGRKLMKALGFEECGDDEFQYNCLRLNDRDEM